MFYYKIIFYTEFIVRCFANFRTWNRISPKETNVSHNLNKHKLCIGLPLRCWTWNCVLFFHCVVSCVLIFWPHCSFTENYNLLKVIVFIVQSPWERQICAAALVSLHGPKHHRKIFLCRKSSRGEHNLKLK